KLYVCGLLPTILREELIREFGPYGKLQEVWVAKKPPGFAFVEFVNARDAERVVHELDGAKILGSKVRIEFAKANKGPDEYP
ncbi:hypothetical protein HELRODRAFT_146726, partial [Helobdella robusta]|uniref:RRM domain-containing protein n=1 Tax=Helobdella robusta TaxID=6412 RepID=T1EJU0_HELRO